MRIEQLMAGAIDLHVHFAPDLVERRVDVVQLARQAMEAGMKAVVVKSHQFDTAPLASVVNQMVNSNILVGSIVLNQTVGGLNPEAVECAARFGAKIVWLPTLSSAEDLKRAKEKQHTSSGTEKESAGISPLDKNGKLVSQMMQILEIIGNNRLVLATGHISIPEVFAVANSALERQISVIITHPLAKPFGTSFTMEQVRELAGKGAYIEHCFLACMPPMRLSPASMIENIRTIGAEHCIISTDFGQAHNPPPTEGFRTMIANMLRFGLSERELEILVKVNPARLLGLM